MKIIPAIDLIGGKCVRLLKGDFAQSTEYSDDPAAVARRFAALGLGDLHLVDLDGARTGEPGNRTIVRQIAAESSAEIQLGGGIRSGDDVRNWLGAGVVRCVVGSVAIRKPDTVKAWLNDYGTESIVLALDVRLDTGNTPVLTTHGWTRDSGISLWDCLDDYRKAGARHVLCTDVSRDGAMAGPNIALYTEILARYEGLQLQASGGVRSIGDMRELRTRGLPAAITGRALLDGEITDEEIAAFRQDA